MVSRSNSEKNKKQNKNTENPFVKQRWKWVAASPSGMKEALPSGFQQHFCRLDSDTYMNRKIQNVFMGWSQRDQKKAIWENACSFFQNSLSSPLRLKEDHGESESHFLHLSTPWASTASTVLGTNPKLQWRERWKTSPHLPTNTCHTPVISDPQLLTISQWSEDDSKLGHFGWEHLFPSLPEFSFAPFQLFISIWSPMLALKHAPSRVCSGPFIDGSPTRPLIVCQSSYQQELRRHKCPLWE